MNLLDSGANPEIADSEGIENSNTQNTETGKKKIAPISIYLFVYLFCFAGRTASDFASVSDKVWAYFAGTYTYSKKRWRGKKNEWVECCERDARMCCLGTMFDWKKFRERAL